MKTIKIDLPQWLIEMLEKHRDKVLKYSSISNIFCKNSVIEVRDGVVKSIGNIPICGQKDVNKLPVIQKNYHTGKYSFDPKKMEIQIK